MQRKLLGGQLCSPLCESSTSPGYDLTICELKGPFSFANLKKLLVVFNTKAKELSSTTAKQALSNPDEPIEGQTPAPYSI